MTVPHWSHDPYWQEAAEAFSQAVNLGRKQVCIDLDALSEVLYRDDGPAHRLLSAMLSVHEQEALDGYRGASRVLAALIMRLSELQARDGSSQERRGAGQPQQRLVDQPSERDSHPAQILWQQHREIADYPEGCLPVPAPIPYTSFFPGGFGLWNPTRSDALPEFPVGGVMVLGHDFHSENGYNDSFQLGMESPDQPTWRSMTGMLREAGVSLESCFFTNFYMGIRRGAATTGRYPGSLSPQFVTACRDFLKVQLEVQQPRLVLVLGAWVPSLVAPLGRGLEPWTSCTTLRGIDERGLSILSDVQLHSGGSSVWAALSHPSFYPRSASGRVFRGHEGREAHELLVTEAVSLARST